MCATLPADYDDEDDDEVHDEHNHASPIHIPPQGTYPVRRGPLTTPALWLIEAYQKFISPALPPSCRFYPTCSAYGHEAIARYGILKGGRLAVWRVLRCNPFSKGGYDPVP